MEIISNILGFLLFVLLISAIYSGSVVPFYRLIIFGKRVTYVKDIKDSFKNKLVKKVSYIFLAVAIAYFLNNAFDSYSTAKNDLISAPQNYETILLPFVRSLEYIAFTIIIIGSIPRSIKESIYEYGIKTDSAFVKWSEIKEIKTDDECRLLIYYKLRSLFFIKTTSSYVIDECSNETKNLICDYWNKENKNSSIEF